MPMIWSQRNTQPSTIHEQTLREIVCIVNFASIPQWQIYFRLTRLQTQNKGFMFIKRIGKRWSAGSRSHRCWEVVSPPKFWDNSVFRVLRCLCSQTMWFFFATYITIPEGDKLIGVAILVRRLRVECLCCLS